MSEPKEWDYLSDELQNRIIKLEQKNEQLRSGIRLLLDNIDYTAGACRVNEAVGAVLPESILRIVKHYAEKESEGE